MAYETEKEYETNGAGNTQKVIYKNSNGEEYTSTELKNIRNMKLSNIVEVGYPLLDNLIKQSENYTHYEELVEKYNSFAIGM